MQMLSNAIQINQCLLKEAVKNADLLVDATCGNGSDTLFLANNAKYAHIYAFDIQKEAIEKTKEKTKKYEKNISYICDSHINMKKYVKHKADAVIFNLGYLPGASHEITTHADTVLKTIDAVKDLLKINGIISILAYPGHAEGYNEYLKLLEYTKMMDKHIFTACWYKLHNHTNAPAMCWIEKQG
ncbi:tRNA (mnm(5)s(2)U34)-methyltransferase [Pectinatus haikarae]|uniref:tRNA1(Val) A37 N6-methylase TrmN6 n=1 Tax=Pectinatus haikarae TaxID=349096 RepID=A0ABT9Y6Y3_9FIRM|nr:class I SAM-dependent methyltransferase [Pectinatus haikarae]MDQ0203413.1 tRNA1(Val) A37 N6-methylase TrmN6 [Pectinatus haikarae]